MFAFKFDKAIQAVAYILRRESSREMNYTRLIKILYIADRISIRKTGRPITGGVIVAMEQGPVMSEILNLIKGTHLRFPEWAMFIQKEEYNIRLIEDPGVANLSNFEIETLERVVEKYRSFGEWDMVNVTHKFPEWKNNKPPRNSMKRIPFRDVLEAVGRSADLSSIEKDAETSRAFARLFGA